MVRVVAVAVFLIGCANNPGVPKYRTSMPAPLPAHGTPRPAETVRLQVQDLPWWTLADSRPYFVLGFDESRDAAVAGPRVGAVRSHDVALDDDLFESTRCAWQIIPFGEPRPCAGLAREEAMAVARAPIDEAMADLRAKVADAGIGAVADVRCFAERVPSAGARLWCEGVAVAVDAPPATDAPSAPIAHAPRTRPHRFVFHADGSVGALSNQVVVASTLGLRYRPFELGIQILDLSRDTVLPRDDGLVGFGITALVRKALGRSRADAIAGGTAIAAFPNGATNPDIDSIYQGFVRVAYQSTWRIGGLAQPFAQLRAGAAYGTATASQVLPMLELHLGLSTPEQR